MPIDKTYRPIDLDLDVVVIDFTTLKMSTDGQEHVLMTTNVFSNFLQPYPAWDQKARTVAKILNEG